MEKWLNDTLEVVARSRRERADARHARRRPQCREQEKPPMPPARRVGPFGHGRGHEPDQRRAQTTDEHLLRMPEAGRHMRGVRQAKSVNERPQDRPEREMQGRQREKDAEALVSQDMAKRHARTARRFGQNRPAHGTLRSSTS
jgi:hypothetical protein